MRHQVVIEILFMALLSLNEAFQAMVRLVNKQNEERATYQPNHSHTPQVIAEGEWVSYPDIARQLGYGYFEQSLYKGISSSINLSNIIDGDVIFTQDKGVIVGDLEECEPWGALMQAFLAFETDKNISEYAHTDVNPKINYKIKEKADTPINSLIDDEFLAKASKISKEYVERQKLKHANKIDYHHPYIPEEDESKHRLHAQAHYELIQWFTDGELTAKALPKLIDMQLDLYKKLDEIKKLVEIPALQWKRMPLPHYEHNALSFGEAHKLYFTKHALENNFPFGRILAAEQSFWLTHICVDAEQFNDLYQPLMMRYYPTPETASIKYRTKDNKLIINFGDDVDIVVKPYKGLQTLRTLILHTNYRSPWQKGMNSDALENLSAKLIAGTNLEEGLDNIHDVQNTQNDTTPEGHELNLGFSDNADNEDTKDYSLFSEGEGFRDQHALLNETKIKISLQKLRQSFKVFWDKKSKPEIKEVAKKSIESKAKYLNAITKDKHYGDSIKCLLSDKKMAKKSEEKRKEILYEVFPYKSIEAEVAANNTIEVIQNRMWNRIELGLDLIKEVAPHFYYHMKGTLTGINNGALKQEGDTINYHSGDQVKWDVDIKSTQSSK
jgi:hypothetical protein